MGRAKLMTDLTFRLAADTAQLKKGLASARKQMGTFQKTTQKLGGILAGAFAGQALISGIGRAIKSIAELERIIKRTSLIAGGGEEAFADLAKQLGSSTVFTAQQAGEAMTFLAQAGFSVNEILDATPGVLDLAAAAQLDLAQAADITSNVLSGFGLAASEVNRVNDILVTTTNSANLNVEMLGESFKLVAPIAKSAGISINKAAGFIGVLGDAGLQGSMAGTQLKGVIAQLINPTAKGAAVMKRLGVEVTKTEEGGLDLSATLKDLKAAGLSTKDAFQLFGKIAATGALVMADATEKADELAIATEKVGAASKQAKDQLNTLSGDIALLGSAWDGLIQKGSALNSVFRFSVQAVTDLLNGYVGVSGAVRKATDAAAKMSEEFKKQNEAAQKTIDIQNLVKGGLRQSGAALEAYLVAIEKVSGGEEAAKIIKEKLLKAQQNEIVKLAELEAAQKKVRLEREKLLELSVTTQGTGTDELAQYGLGQTTIEGIKVRVAEISQIAQDASLLIRESIQSGLIGLGEGIGQLAASGLDGMEGFLTSFMNLVVNFGRSFGKLLISLGIAKVSLEKIGISGVGAIIAGTALIAASALIGSLISKGAGTERLANGGVSSGGLTMVGERGAELVNLPTNSRVLSHPDTMKAIGGGGSGTQRIEVVGMIRGEDIWFANNEANRKLGNTRG